MQKIGGLTFVLTTPLFAACMTTASAATGNIQVCVDGGYTSAGRSNYSSNITSSSTHLTPCGSATATFTSGTATNGYVTYYAEEIYSDKPNQPPVAEVETCTLTFQTSINSSGQCTVSVVASGKGGGYGGSCSASTTYNAQTCDFTTSEQLSVPSP